ncbi:hypothetical protein ABPG72_019909 [Tetrahymena utriculariae]
MDQINQNQKDQPSTLQKLVSYIQKRQKIKQMYKDKGIQMLEKPELLKIYKQEYIELKQSDFSKKNIINDLEQIIKYSQNQLQKQENETKKQDETIKQFKRSNTNLKKQVKSQESTIKDLKEQLQQQLNKNKQFSQIINQQEIYKQENQNLEEKIAKLKQSDFRTKNQDEIIKQFKLSDTIQKQNEKALENTIKDQQKQMQQLLNENKNLEEKVANQSKSLDYKFSNFSKSFFLSSSI